VCLWATWLFSLDDASSPPAIARRVHLARGVCAGMVALHSHDVLHLDIESTNVVIGGDAAPLIADFGLSIEISKTLSFVASAHMTGGRVQGARAVRRERR